MKKILTLTVIAVTALALLAGCGAKTAAVPHVTSTAVRADVAKLEARLVTCAKAHGLLTRHARRRTLACAFPKGEAAPVEKYAVQHFTPGVITSRATRDAWYQAIASYALSAGGSR